MLTITEERPIITLTYEGRMTLDDTQQYMDTLDRAITHGQPFAILTIAHEDNSKNREKGVNSTLGKWVKENKSNLAKLCFGYVTVANSSGLFKLYKPMAKMVGTKMMGCPCEVFQSMDEEIAWLNEQQKIQETRSC